MEGAIVPFKGKASGMPMVAGIMKKVRNSGEIADWNAHAVYENDEVDYLLGDDQRIYHKPTMGDPGQVVGAYSIVKLKDGTISRDFMPDRKSVVSGKSVSVRVDLGGRRIIKKTTRHKNRVYSTITKQN